MRKRRATTRIAQQWESEAEDELNIHIFLLLIKLGAQVEQRLESRRNLKRRI